MDICRCWTKRIDTGSKRGGQRRVENGTDVCVIYLSALSVHRAEQRANIVFTHTHGFAMQIIWYYCTYSAYRRGSSVTGTASNPSFLPRHPLASSIYLRDTRALYTRIHRCIEESVYPVIAAFSSSLDYLRQNVFQNLYRWRKLDIARFAFRGMPVLFVPVCLDNRWRSSNDFEKIRISLKLIFNRENHLDRIFIIISWKNISSCNMKVK